MLVTKMADTASDVDPRTLQRALYLIAAWTCLLWKIELNAALEHHTRLRHT